MGTGIGSLTRAAPESVPVYEFVYPEMAEQIREATEALRLESVVPYLRQTSGPSWDQLHHRKGQTAAMRTGRLRSLSSLACHKKGGTVTIEYLKLQFALQTPRSACAQRLDAVRW